MNAAPTLATVADDVAALCGVVGVDECAAPATGYALLFHSIAQASGQESLASLKEEAAQGILWELIGHVGTIGDIASRLQAAWSLVSSLPQSTDFCVSFNTVTHLSSGQTVQVEGYLRFSGGAVTGTYEVTQSVGP